MPGFEDRLRDGLRGAVDPADPTRAFERILEKKTRRRILRKVELLALVVTVLGATAGGTYALSQAFSGIKRPAARVLRVHNGYIAFARNKSDRSQIFVMLPTGSHVIQLVADQRDDNHPAWSPDGTRLAFDGGDPVDTSIRDIFVVNSDGTNLIRLTDGSGVAEEPSWSPDGKWIVYARESAFFKIRSDGKGEAVVVMGTRGGCTYRTPAWSPDGIHIAFLSQCPNEPSSIHVMNTDLTGERVIATGSGLDSGPAWSPDGKTILFGENGQVVHVGADGRNKSTLTARLGDYAARFSPDGTRIVFESKRDRNLEIYVMNANGSGQTKLTNDPAQDVSPSWQPLPAGSPAPPAPTPAPSPTTAPAPSPPPLGPGCDASSVVADFNGTLDGEPLSLDVATVALSKCLLTPQERTGSTYNTRYALDVRWGPVYKGGSAEGVFPIPDCYTVCRALGAVDINHDGAAELLLVVDQGASTRFLEVWDLPESEACCTRFDVARPGAPGYPPNQPIRLAYGGSVTHQDAITCDAGAHGSHLLVATHFSLSQDQGTWRASETVFAFDGRSFKVISSRSYTAPVNPAGQSPPPPRGKDCINAQNG